MFNFIKKMLCRHEWEWEQSLLGGEFKVCRKCNKEVVL